MSIRPASLRPVFRNRLIHCRTRLFALLLAVTIAQLSWGQQQDDLFSGVLEPETSSQGSGDALDLGAEAAPEETPEQAEFRQAGERAAQLLQEGKYREAIEEFGKQLAMSPTYLPAHVGRGQAFMALESYDEAIGEFTQVLTNPMAVQSEPSLLAQVYLSRGKAYAEIARYREAVDDLTQAVAMDPNNPEVLYELSRATLLLTVTSPGQGMDQAGQRNLMQALQTLTHAIELKPEYGEAYLMRGRILARLQLYDDAIDDLQQAVRILGPTSAAAAELATAYGQRANMELAQPDGDTNKMVDDLKASIQQATSFLSTAQLGAKSKPWESRDPLEPQAERVLMLRAEAMITIANQMQDASRQELYRAAMADCEKILQLDARPEILAQAHFNRGHALRMLGELEKAVDAFTQAIRKFPRYSEAYLRRGICYFYLHRDEAAVQDFQVAAANPVNPFQYDPRAKLWEGLTSARQERFQDAINSYTRAIQASPSYIPAYMNRALAYWKTGRIDQVREDLNTVIRLEPEHQQALQYLKQLAASTSLVKQ